MALESVQLIQVTSAGGTVTLDMTQPLPDFIGLWNNAITLGADFTLDTSGSAPSGTVITIGINALPTYPGGIPSLNLNGFRYTVFGLLITQEMLNNPFVIRVHIADSGSITTYPIAWFEYISTFGAVQNVSGLSITDATLPLTAIEDVTSGQIIVGDSSDRPQAVAMSGDVTISNTGATAIGNNKVTNAMLNGSIARTKIASGTASRVIVNDGSGDLAEATTLSATLGGTGQNNASATGFQKWSSGTSSVGTITDTKHCQVQFGTGYVGDFKIRMGFAGTFTGVYGFLAHDLGAADGTVIVKNNAGTTMTGSTLSFTSGDTKGTATSGNITANNTFLAGDVITVTTSGGGNSGVVMISLDFTRNS